ncbi:MAG: single-stranded-DNA-specific exonuclease RecJ [bacterium]
MQITTHATVGASDSTQDIIEQILRIRGVGKDEEKEFLNPVLPDLSDLIAQLGIDIIQLDHAKSIVDQAIAQGQKICVYGDYDADGITATAIMWLTLSKLGAKVLPFIPSRTRHGYGLSDASVAELLSGQGFANSKYRDFVPDIIITVDNGIVASKQIQKLVGAGKKVILTDHHQPTDSLPNCDALIHTIKTSGAGISWVAARYFSKDATFAKERIDLATIGIVADQMPVIGVNRGVIKYGLKAIEQTNLLGLRTILSNAGIAGKALTTYDINYVIGPRINAVGRIDDALAALRLLCTGNKQVADELSQSMELLNKERQQLTDSAIEDALKHIDDNKITIVASADYHHGVIGLIAGKLAEKTHKPAIAMSIDGNLVKGSARSVTGVNVTELLRKHAGLLSGVGGHEQAAGFSLPIANLDEFISALTEDVNTNIGDDLLQNTTIVDLEIPITSTSLELASAVERLEPYGIGNIKPRFVSFNLNVLEDRAMGDGGKHHKLTIECKGKSRTAIWFNGQPITKAIKTLIYSLNINNWKNKKELQLVASYVEI